MGFIWFLRKAELIVVCSDKGGKQAEKQAEKHAEKAENVWNGSSRLQAICEGELEKTQIGLGIKLTTFVDF